MTMPAQTDEADRPSADMVRAALERMLASDAFRASPQLASFLRYVVEATLRGEAERIKGYTIAVEALGRSANFDPQADPIVRVEAARLRRALSRYHASSDGTDPVTIELPLGTYVPVFRQVAQPAPESTPSAVAVQSLLARSGMNWRRLAAGAVLFLIGAGTYGLLDLVFDFNTPSPSVPQASVATPARAATETRRGRLAFPLVMVGPIAFDGSKTSIENTSTVLLAKLRESLARFDEIQVVSEAQGQREERGYALMSADNAGPSVDYRLAGRLEANDDGTLSFSAWLVDTADGSIVYTRTFSRIAADASWTEDTVVRELSALLAQPYGVIHAREAAKYVASSEHGDPRYRCILDAYDYWRSYDPAQHARVRDCLERATEQDPTFAVGFAGLSQVYEEEYRFGFNPRPDDVSPLQRALIAGRRAAELKPASARAYQNLMYLHFTRGEYKLALEAGEKAVMLNPNDPDILADFGAHLVALGETEKGARKLQEAASLLVVRPAWHDFFLFLSAYLADDGSGAERYAAQITSETYPLGLVARALVAAHRGNKEQARQVIERLVAVQPAWRNDSRRELKKSFAAERIVERLAGDLARAGLGATN